MELETYIQSSFSDYDNENISLIHNRAIYYYTKIMGRDFKVGKLFKAPYRLDNHPSLSIFYSKDRRKILWRDHAEGEHGDIIDLYRRVYDKSLPEAIDEMLDNNIQFDPINLLSTPYFEEEKEKADISVHEVPWCAKSFYYWKRYHISYNTLLNYQVVPINAYMCNNKLMLKASFPDNPSYVYKIFASIKIYSPLRPKSHKWRGNCDNYDIQGYQQLSRHPDNLFITKSLKDVMIIHQMGFDAIAPQSEVAGLPENVIAAIKNLGYRKMYIFFDNDATGIKGAQRMQEYFPDATNICIIENAEKIKDISDLVYVLGYDIAYKWLVTRMQDRLNT